MGSTIIYQNIFTNVFQEQEKYIYNIAVFRLNENVDWIAY